MHVLTSSHKVSLTLVYSPPSTWICTLLNIVLTLLKPLPTHTHSSPTWSTVLQFLPLGSLGPCRFVTSGLKPCAGLSGDIIDHMLPLKLGKQTFIIAFIELSLFRCCSRVARFPICSSTWRPVRIYLLSWRPAIYLKSCH